MSNNQLPADPRKRWQYKENFYSTGCDDYDGHYEVTNGEISLCTTDDPGDDNNENSLERVAKALNESGCKFYVNTTTEHVLHIENMTLRGVLEDIARQKLYGEPSDEYDHMYTYEETVKMARETLKRLKEHQEQQWKEGKAIEPVLTEEQAFEKWKKENVTVLGEFDFIVGHKRVHGKKELRRVYEYLTNPPK